jgi:hypothetical protein
MERYARLLLAFLHQATRGAPRQIFAFGTDLTDINHAFKLRDTDDMLTEASHQIKDFAGGTQLGKSLAHLRVNFAKKLTGRRTVVLLISVGSSDTHALCFGSTLCSDLKAMLPLQRGPVF